jgi:hypothetical protein
MSERGFTILNVPRMTLQSRTFTRRAFLATTLAVTAASGPSAGAAQSGRTKLFLLGTGGGPRPRKASSGSAQVIVCNNVAYVIDCGDAVARQLVFAGVPLTTLRHVFITHQHSDHDADYGNLIWLAWASGLGTRVDTWGPPPLERMTKLFLEMNAYDIDTRAVTFVAPRRFDGRREGLHVTCPHRNACRRRLACNRLSPFGGGNPPAWADRP